MSQLGVEAFEASDILSYNVVQDHEGYGRGSYGITGCNQASRSGCFQGKTRDSKSYISVFEKKKPIRDLGWASNGLETRARTMQ